MGHALPQFAALFALCLAACNRSADPWLVTVGGPDELTQAPVDNELYTYQIDCPLDLRAGSNGEVALLAHLGGSATYGAGEPDELTLAAEPGDRALALYDRKGRLRWAQLAE